MSTSELPNLSILAAQAEECKTPGCTKPKMYSRRVCKDCYNQRQKNSRDAVSKCDEVATTIAKLTSRVAAVETKLDQCITFCHQLHKLLSPQHA